MQRTGIILQARMGSSRLPGKVLRPLAGRPMLAWILERLAAVTADAVIVATSDRPADDAIADACAALGCAVFRGSELDVLDRYYRCGKAHGLDVVVRATADNPFVDALAGDAVIQAVVNGGNAYACSEGYPRGVGLEAMRVASLERSWREGHAPHHREHVNEYILEHPELFPQVRVPAPPALHAPARSLTVDTPAEFAMAERIYDAWLVSGAGPVPVAFALQHLEAHGGDAAATGT